MAGDSLICFGGMILQPREHIGEPVIATRTTISYRKTLKLPSTCASISSAAVITWEMRCVTCDTLRWWMPRTKASGCCEGTA